jgi:opacity protein-like surface antigen
MNRFCNFILVFFFVFCASEVVAQGFYAKRNQERIFISGGVGFATYLGDLVGPDFTFKVRPGAKIGVGYDFTDRLTGRAEVLWYNISGDDADAEPGDGRLERNLSFRAHNFEMNAVAIMHLFDKGDRKNIRRFNAYGFAGFGVTLMNATAELDGQRYSLKPLMTEGIAYSRAQPVIPFGAGVTTALTYAINVGVEFGYRYLFSDYLDDVSSSYPDPSIFGDNDVARSLSDRRPEIGIDPASPGSVRGNPDNDDAYYILTFKINYYIDSQRSAFGPRRPKSRKGAFKRKRKF